MENKYINYCKRHGAYKLIIGTVDILNFSKNAIKKATSGFGSHVITQNAFLSVRKINHLSGSFLHLVWSVRIQTYEGGEIQPPDHFGVFYPLRNRVKTRLVVCISFFAQSIITRLPQG